MVEIGDDYITVYDDHGEIVHWVEDEWIDDPSVTISIANAITLYYTRGPNSLRELLKIEVD